MKVYRVVPNTFSTGERLDSSRIPGGEDIYYKLGYASFVGERGFHKHNNLFDESEQIEDGKYFFLFLEDAIKQGYYLLTMFHYLRDVGSFYILEYDFPEEVVLKHFGYGDYLDKNGCANPLFEVFIDKKDFSTGAKEVIGTQSLSSKLIQKTLFDSFGDVLKAAERIVAFAPTEFVLYDNYFEKNYWQGFYDVVDNSEITKDILVNSRLFSEFLQLSGKLIKSPYLTGNIISVNLEELMYKYSKWSEVAEYFKLLGWRFDVSKEQKEFKSELLRYSGYNSLGNKEPDEVRRLLKERHY